MLQSKAFHEFHPIGGVAARMPLVPAEPVEPAPPPALAPPVGTLPPLEPPAPPAPPAPVGDPIVDDEPHPADTANRAAQSARPLGAREGPVTLDDRIDNHWRCVACIVRKESL